MLANRFVDLMPVNTEMMIYNKPISTNIYETIYFAVVIV